ncbi:amidase [Streptomyces diacarni]|uniref:Amidase n=1 Tax=Streptomyces diacarni TaxID=2800381 RepID=A0A367F8Q9_9ACTN|nr:amidase [Streptomyces diacarni]RCG26734.1 amidase [Streptomyces diacarni]
MNGGGDEDRGSHRTPAVLDTDAYAGLSACEIAAGVWEGRLTAREVTEAALARIAASDGAVRAFTETWPAWAAERAAEVDRAVRAGVRLPLAGVPLGVKNTQRVTSPRLARLTAAGCVPVGATATPGPGTEWQTWGATERGPTRNPLGPRWSPGGSSAGSAAAVAARMVPLATGSDGAGSVRIPAAWCAVIGLKTTGGLAPAQGRTVRGAPGPLARTAGDAAAYVAALRGSGNGVGGSIGTVAPPRTTPPRPVRTAWSATLGFADTEDEVADTAHGLLEALTSARITAARPAVTVLLPDPARCWRELRAPDGERSSLGTARADIDARTDRAPRTDHHAARTDRVSPAAARTASALALAVREIFTEVDMLATPTTPGPPHGHEGPGAALSVALTWAFNITGHPALSLSAGRTADGAPVGLQLVAPHGREADLLAVAAAAEREGLV